MTHVDCPDARETPPVKALSSRLIIIVQVPSVGGLLEPENEMMFVLAGFASSVTTVRQRSQFTATSPTELADS